METISPRPLSRIEPGPIPARGQHEQNGVSEADVLLHAIVVTARKPLTVTTKSALRRLVVKTARELALDF